MYQGNLADQNQQGEDAMPTLLGGSARPLAAGVTAGRSPFGRRALLIPVSLALAAAPAALADEVPLEDLKATAIIESCGDDPQLLGVATLREEASEEGVKQVSVVLQITEPNRVLPAGKHAVHIHEFGLCAPSCTDAGGHFDPGPAGFSSPDGNHPFHSGDLVNLGVSATGQGFLRTDTSRVTLSPGPLSLFDEDGSALIVHVDPDTYCPEGEAAGCAGGARAACGVIELAD
jgi:superoxide dismutase, Cu-Zn family